MRIAMFLLLLPFWGLPATARAAFGTFTNVTILQGSTEIASDSAAAGDTAAASGPYGTGSATTEIGSQTASASSLQWDDPTKTANTIINADWYDRIRIDGGTPGTSLSILVSVGITGTVGTTPNTVKPNAASVGYVLELGTQEDGFQRMDYSAQDIAGFEIPSDPTTGFGGISYEGGVLVQSFNLRYGELTDIRSRLDVAVNEGASATAAATSIALQLPPGATLTSDSGFAYPTPEPDAVAAAFTACAALALRARRAFSGPASDLAECHRSARGTERA